MHDAFTSNSNDIASTAVSSSASATRLAGYFYQPKPSTSWKNPIKQNARNDFASFLVQVKYKRRSSPEAQTFREAFKPQILSGFM